MIRNPAAGAGLANTAAANHPAWLKDLAQRLEQVFPVLLPANVRDVHADLVRRINRGSHQPFPGRHLRLLGHGPDLGGIVVNILDDIICKFHCYLLVTDTMIPSGRDRCWKIIQSSG